MIRHSAPALGRAMVALSLSALVTLSLSRGASAQTMPKAVASPSPAASPTAAPNAIGPALGTNDPCTNLAAIVTRPTVTNSVCTVRPNHVEIETGYLNTTAANGGGNVVTYPQTLIRVGTKIPALELQIAPPTVARASAGGTTTQGSTDVGAGLKYVFGYTPKFNYGGQVFVTAPTGTNGFSAGGSGVIYALNAGYTLSPVFSLATTLGEQSLSNGVQHFSSFVPSLVLTAAFPGNTGISAEIAQFSNANGPGTATRTQYIYAIYHGIGQRLQVDASFATSPTAATGKYRALGFGLSYYL
ncbi:MAG: hypothetical protein NVS4B13_10770 [Candidatus Elarobacter sp.]